MYIRMKSKKNISILVIIHIIMILFLFDSTAFFITYKSMDNEWISALIQSIGNVIGGLLGGVVAYYVAKYQINKQDQIKNAEERRNLRAKLMFLSKELQTNSRILDVFKKNSSNKQGKGVEICLEELSVSIWKEIGYQICTSKNINSDIFGELYKTYNKIMMIKKMSVDENICERVEVLSTDINTCISRIEEIVDNEHLLIS